MFCHRLGEGDPRYVDRLFALSEENPPGSPANIIRSLRGEYVSMNLPAYPDKLRDCLSAAIYDLISGGYVI